MFVFTFDTDWALEPLLDDTLKLLNDYKIKSTFFLTNKIDSNLLNNHELAIHPNFEGFSNQEEILSKTLEILPTKKSKGCRSHKLYHNSPLMMSYEKFGIEYDSNYYLPDYNNIQPFFLKWANVLEIPIYFCDDAHYETNSSFDLKNINLNNEGIKVFLFHPFHIFMNTSSDKDYQQHKSNYKDFEYLDNHKNSDNPGTRSLFVKILDFVEKNNIETKTMAEVNDYYRKKSK